jgi:hypothetical protein
VLWGTKLHNFTVVIKNRFIIIFSPVWGTDYTMYCECACKIAMCISNSCLYYSTSLLLLHIMHLLAHFFNILPWYSNCIFICFFHSFTCTGCVHQAAITFRLRTRDTLANLTVVSSLHEHEGRSRLFFFFILLLLFFLI